MQGSFTVNAGALASAVKYVAQWIAPKPTLPIHAGARFAVADGVLTVSGFNDDATAHARLAVEGDADGAFVVSGRLINTLMGTLPAKPVSFEMVGPSVAVSSGRFGGSMPTMAITDWPSLDSVATPVGTVAGADFADAVHRIASAAKKDPEGTPGLTGVHLSFGTESGEPISLMASDRYRAARQSVEWAPDGAGADPFEALVPAVVLHGAADAFVDDEATTLLWSPGTFGLTTRSRSLTVRQIDEPFPLAALNTILAGPTAARAEFSPRDLIDPLKRVCVLRNPESTGITLTFTENLLTVHGESTSGEGGEEVDIKYDGPDCVMLVRSGALQSALAGAPTSAAGDTVEMAFVPDSNKPVIFSTAAEPTWRYMIVPLVQLGATA